MAGSTTQDGERSGEAMVDAASLPADASRRLRWGAYLIALSGLGLVVNGVAMLYRAFFTPEFEAGVETLGGITAAELAGSNHELYHYVVHLHVNVAGLMIALGLGVSALAWYGVRRGERWAWATAVGLPVVFLAHSLPVHQTAEFSFDALLHLGPGAVWLPALVVGAVLAHQGLRAAASGA